MVATSTTSLGPDGKYSNPGRSYTYLEIVILFGNNPTEAPIEATISTPAEITDHKSFQKKVKIPSGTSVFWKDE